MLKSKWVRGLAIGLGAAVIGLLLLLTGALDGLEATTWDIRVRMFAAPTEATDDVVLILINQQSIDLMIENYAVSWPWPRSIYAYLIQFAQEAGAESFTFDIILQDQGAGGPDDDNLLLYAAEGYERFVYAVELRDDESGSNSWPDYFARPGLSVSNFALLDDVVEEELTYNRSSFPHPDVSASNAGIGFANQENDADGVFRRYRLLAYHLDQPVPSLALAAYAAAKGDAATISYDERAVTIDGVVFPINRNGDVLLKYTTPGDPAGIGDELPLHTFYTAWDIIQSALALEAGVDPAVDPDELKGKYILFGPQAAGLLDLRPTPLDPRAPGVTVHAQMLDNLLSGEVMQDFPFWATLLVLVLLTVGAAVGATYIEKTWLMAIAIVLFLAIPFLFAWGGYALGYWYQFVMPLVAVFVALAGANVANYATEGAARREIRGMFGRYLSPDVISELEQDPSALELGGKEADITIYFSDIQKFSTISTKLKPDELVQFLNVYLTPMTNAILEEGGLIDKYEGDAIIAMWGAPRERDDHARAGLSSMLKCQAALDSLRPALKEQIGTDVYQRIGMSTGKATVGNMGSELRTDYTMIGDAVNLAARLEGANKAFGTYSMVSQDTINSAGGLDAVRREVCAVRELGYIAVVGREDKPVRVYEPMPQETYDSRSDVFAVYQKGVTLFQAGEFSEARSTFARIAEHDPAAASYMPRCEQLMKEPPAGWNGVWVLTEKG